MDLMFIVIFFGIVEGFIEFIFVFLIGYLIFVLEIFGYDVEQWKVFNVVIQLGVILVVIVQYWCMFWVVGWGLLCLNL